MLSPTSARVSESASRAARSPRIDIPTFNIRT
jgi:hypothetical protein